MWRIVYRECRDKVLFLNVFMCVSLNFHPVWRIFYIEYMDIFFQMCSHVFLEISILYKGFCTESTMNVFLYVPLISHDLWKILDRECRDNIFMLNVFSSDSLNYHCMWMILYRKCSNMVFLLNVFSCVSLNFYKLWRIFCQLCKIKVLPRM